MFVNDLHANETILARSIQRLTMALEFYRSRPKGDAADCED
jgi:hypothetical protein